MLNLIAQFRAIFPDPLLEVGTVVAIDNGMATVELAGGGRIPARGIAGVTDRVWVRNGVIEGSAPTLTYVEEEI